MKRTGVALIVGFFLLLGVGILHAEEVKVGAGGTPVDLILTPVKTPFEKTTGITIKLLEGNATVSFKQLYDGQVEASMAGTSFEDLLATLKKGGFEVKDPAAFRPVTVGKSSFYVIVHKDNPVAKLSKDQLRGIFTGKIANWKDVGGKDMPVIPVLSKINPATNAAFNKMVLDNAPYAKSFLDTGRFDEMRKDVASNPETIGFGPNSVLGDGVKSVEIPDFSRPVIFITKGAPSQNAKKLLDFIRGEGQKYVKQ